MVGTYNNSQLKKLNYMSTTIVTIVISVISTLLIISLSLMTWVIVNLKRRVSKLEGLSLESAEQFQNIYREFDVVGRNHDEKIKDIVIQNERNFESISRNIDQQIEGIFNVLKDVEHNFEKKLDKRFENAYQKIKRLTEK